MTFCPEDGWFAAVASPHLSYGAVAIPFVLGGVGTALFYAPVANVVLSSVRAEDEGKASGANNAIRELGGVFGVAVLASIFAANGSYVSALSFVDGMIPALRVGAVVVAFGAIAALALGGRVRVPAPEIAGGRRDLEGAAAA